MEMIDFLVARDDFARTRWAQAPLPELAEGEVLATIERFAFTANNMTYAGFGADMRYWDFFPAGPGFGKIPVWGTGRIIRSRHPDLPDGEAIYGYVPMSSHVLLRPATVRPRAFVDGAPHRLALPATYNEYVRLAQDADYDPAQADLHLVLRPLFALAFFIGAWLRENAFFGASTVIVSSASSKTGLAIGSVLQDAGVATLGLTSPGNRAFVESTGIFDRVADYGEIETLDRAPSVYVDIADNPDIRRRVHAHFNEQLRHSSRAGFTHGVAGVAEPLPGPEPVFFFTPTHILALRKAWGPDVLRERLIASQRRVFARLAPHLRIRTGVGQAAVEMAYHEVRTGRAAPQDAWILCVPEFSA